jgi:NADH-quinone oxidoreductase subunit G
MVQILQADRGRHRAPRRTSTPCSTPATTSSAARSAPWATARPARSPAPCSTSATSSSRARTPRPGSCSRRLRDRPCSPTSDRHDRTGRYGMSLSTGHEVPRGGRPRGPGHAHHRRIEVQAPKGSLLIRVAEELGIAIPRFCDHPLLEPAGACRQCLVEVAMPDREGNVRKMPKPQASCTTTVPGHGRQDPGTSPGGRQGAARHHGDAAGQPPARLPDLRQGRRVPAAEPGDEQRPRRVALRRRQAHLPQADQDLDPGAARPRALHPVPALHPVHQGDRRRHVHRPAERGAKQQITFDTEVYSRPRALPSSTRPTSYFSGNTIQICPVGALTGSGLPLPRPPVRPGLLPDGLRALRLRLRRAHRPPPRQGAAPAGRRGPGGQRGVELRQGPLGLHLRQQPDRLTRSRSCATRSAASWSRTSWPEALDVAARGLAAARDERRGGNPGPAAG